MSTYESVDKLDRYITSVLFHTLDLCKMHFVNEELAKAEKHTRTAKFIEELYDRAHDVLLELFDLEDATPESPAENDAKSVN